MKLSKTDDRGGQALRLAPRAFALTGTAVTTLVRPAPVPPGAVYPEHGCAGGTFTNGERVEFATLDACGPIAPGAAATPVEHRAVLDGLDRPDTDAAFARLAAAAAKGLRTL